MARAALEAALRTARARHSAISAGDYEAYDRDSELLAEACRGLVAGGAETFEQGDIPALDELIGLETQSRRLLEAMMAETRTSLDGLNRSRHAAGAYGAQERLSVNGV